MEIREEELLFHHFSHEHPLEWTNSPSSESVACYGCRLNLLSGKDYYNCKTCPFSLHQVCYNMPRNIKHPVDPIHNLTLLATPSSAKGTSDCKACGQNITGFYYFCAKCGDHYHILCSLVPLYFTIPSHPHTLNLEFSPPYDFECDLCNRPGYSGWLYRCGLCDFDAHIACAISDQRAQSLRHQPVPLPDTLTRPSHKTTSGYSSATHPKNNPCVDYYRIKGNELMQLIAWGVVAGKGESDRHDIVPTVEGGWDDGLDCSKWSGTSSCPRKQSQPSTPPSEDLTLSSYQFSDAYFSIDLTRTYPGDANMNQAYPEASPNETRGVPEIKETNNRGYIIMPNRLFEPGFDPHYRGPENRQNGAIPTGFDTHIEKELGQENKKREATGFRDRSDIKDRSAESDTARLGCSCWSKLFVCCYYPRNLRF